MTKQRNARTYSCWNIKFGKKKLIDEFNAQTTMLSRIDKELRDRLQAILQQIAAAKGQIHGLEAEREKAKAECSKFTLYFKLLKEWLKVI